jgi:hypothetical protein
MDPEQKDSKVAFPVYGHGHTGLTRRELFAALALQGLLANSDITKNMAVAAESKNPKFCLGMAELAVNSSDALIKRLDF